MKVNVNTSLKRNGATIILAAGLALVGAAIRAGEPAPTEHKGLSFETHGLITEESMISQVGLGGHILLLRTITIAPGGQIAMHDHAGVPSLVKVISGEWIAGTASGEQAFDANTQEAIIENMDSVNWFFNRGTVPASAIVCDIKPAS